MTTFIHGEPPLMHAGVERVEAAIDHLAHAGEKFKGARGLAVMLLGAVASALVVVAERIVVNLPNGGLLVGWMMLWGLAFAAIALLADTARSLSLRITAAWGPEAAPSRSDQIRHSPGDIDIAVEPSPTNPNAASPTPYEASATSMPRCLAR